MLRHSSSYTRLDSLRDIIEDNNRLIVVLNRFDIALGFGDKSVEEVCRCNGVDTDTFLAVINFISDKEWQSFNISLLSLMGYLRKSHARFLDYYLPHIKRTLIEGIHDAGNSEIAIVILRYYDGYFEEVRSHMDYEDTVVFAYVESLLKGNASDRFRIADFSSSHDHMSAKLNDLKELFIYKYKQKNNEAINNALIQLTICGKELIQHCDIEKLLLLPLVENLEREVNSRHAESSVTEDKRITAVQSENLTDREKEVLRWVALGLSTKEIAETMCLSFHTINTYRKNIGCKLNIHSVTGMAFYAVLHNIIDIREIEIP